MGITASAPAKAILFGEHFVVYGEPAIVLAIDKRAYATAELRDDKRMCFHSLNPNLSGSFENGILKAGRGSTKETRMRFEPLKTVVEKVQAICGDKVGLNIEVDSKVPIAAGLGSSAAVAAATAAAVGALLDVRLSREDVYRISYEAEKITHGTPSGVDSAVSTFGGTMLFQMDVGFKPLEVKADIPLVIGDTGVKRSTHFQVAKVRDLNDKYPRILEPMMKAARQIVMRAVDALKEGDLRTIGDLMNLNNALLCGLGVSDESLEWLISTSRKSGAMGAKLTGAGGGGCMIAIVEDGRIQQVLRAIRRCGGKPFLARKTDEGVKIEGF